MWVISLEARCCGRSLFEISWYHMIETNYVWFHYLHASKSPKPNSTCGWHVRSSRPTNTLTPLVTCYFSLFWRKYVFQWIIQPRPHGHWNFLRSPFNEPITWGRARLYNNRWSRCVSAQYKDERFRTRIFQSFGVECVHVRFPATRFHLPESIHVHIEHVMNGATIWIR